MFDLFEQTQTRAPAASKRTDRARGKPGATIFDLFPSESARSTARVRIEEPVGATPLKPTASRTTRALEPPVPRQKPGLVATTSLAKEKERLENLSADLQKQQEAQKGEARRLAAISSQQEQERDDLLKQRHELELLRKSLTTTQPNGPAGSLAPQKPGRKPNSMDENPPPIASQTPSFNGPAERNVTRLARTEPVPPTTSSLRSSNFESPECKTAKALIEGYAFSNIQAKACEGTTYQFSATRDNSTFSIRVNPQTWELSEVIKVPKTSQ